VEQSYDYVIVGAGSAGCVLANRLSFAEEARVLLIEAGGPQTLPEISRPQSWRALRTSSANWGETTVEQAASGSSIPLARGFGLGGSSAINAMVFARGHRTSYDAWVAAGASGWGFDDLLPAMRRSETALRRDPQIRGTSGPLRVGAPEPLNPFFTACLQAATERGNRLARDVSGGVEEGFGPPDQNIVDGRRQSSADAYLTSVAQRPNLTVLTGSIVHRLLFDQGRCTGVRLGSVSGRVDTVRCDREVVLSAGTVGSAKLLMLSGVGPADHLCSLGVPVMLDVPGVGSNFHDHPVCPVVFESLRPVPESASNHAEVFGLLRSKYATDAPDLQIIFIDIPVPPPGHRAIPGGYTVRASIMSPYSRGTVRLSGPSLEDPLLIDPNYYADERDVQVMIEGVRASRDLGYAAALSPWRGTEVWPGPDLRTDQALDAYVRASLGSYSHPVGTCRMGSDPAAVVDTELRLNGLENVRVVDASVMPSVVSSNINATVYAIAERAAEMITDDV
jgi:choline dehydrogenase-like flavoprotein